MNTKCVAVLIFLFIAGRAGCAECIERDLTYRDEARSRDIPIRLYAPAGMDEPHKVVLISGGYGISESAYGFIARELVRRGFVVASVQHHLPTDEPLAMSGDLYKLRMPVWTRGVENLKFVLSELKRNYPALDIRHLALVGHSNGGDISCLFEATHPADVESVVTLDHRRMPIPRVRQPRFLSIRADEYEADAGVLPSPEEQGRLRISIVHLNNTKHTAMLPRQAGCVTVMALTNGRITSITFPADLAGLRQALKLDPMVSRALPGPGSLRQSAIGESRRDQDSKPTVARNELRWVDAANRCHFRSAPRILLI